VHTNRDPYSRATLLSLIWEKIDDFPLSSFERWAFLIDLEKRGTDTTRDDLILTIQREDVSGESNVDIGVD
jgi:hypothetical protein